MAAFLDTNVVLTVTDETAKHYDWASSLIEELKVSGPVIISDIVYAELSAGIADQDALNELLRDLAIERIAETDEALFRAGRAFRKYRDSGAPRENLLPDFLIGAIAATYDAPLATLNKKDFAGYFPELALLTP